ncbi:hypothetical protein BHE74_00047083 [Ensete ventricosum]|nr:hypothetical protein BHE74_00047083 [Ensete ventricosum]
MRMWSCIGNKLACRLMKDPLNVQRIQDMRKVMLTSMPLVTLMMMYWLMIERKYLLKNLLDLCQRNIIDLFWTILIRKGMSWEP